MTQTDDALKPCPFCGGVAIRVQSDGFGNVYHKCLDCNSRGPSKFLKEPDPTSWSTRADLATQPDPRVTALEKALRDAGDYIDKGRPQMAQNIIRNAIAALDAGGKDE